MTKADSERLARIVGELGDLASYKDIDTAAELMRQAAGVLGVSPESIPGYAKISKL